MIVYALFVCLVLCCFVWFSGLLAWALIGLCIDICYLLVNFMFVGSLLEVAEIFGFVLLVDSFWNFLMILFGFRFHLSGELLDSMKVWIAWMFEFIPWIASLMKVWMYVWIKCINWINHKLLLCGFACIEMIHMLLLIDFFTMWTSMYECLASSACGYFFVLELLLKLNNNCNEPTKESWWVLILHVHV